MKKQQQHQKTITLSTEVVRALAAKDLGAVAGGATITCPLSGKPVNTCYQ